MVSARGLAALLALLVLGDARAGRAQAGDPADSTAALDPAREDALEDAEGETGLVLDDPGAALERGEAPAPGPSARGRWRAAGGAQALALSLHSARGRMALTALLAREPRERRTVDDLALRLAWRPSSAFSLALGRVLPDVGAGLVLGPALVGTRAPGSAARGPAIAQAPLPTASPARAAGGFEGAWLETRRGDWRLGVLVADTRRDARRVGEAWLPVAGVRHRTAREDSARDALGERALAAALSRGPWWLVVAGARSDPRRVPPPGASAAEQRAARIVTGAGGLEVGARVGGAEWNAGARLEAALALDARGKTRSTFTGEFAPRGARSTRAALLLETESAGFTPLRARPERRPHAHVGVLARGPIDGADDPWTWRLEAHAIERRPYEAARLWSALRATAPGGGWIELRRDAGPVRALLAFRTPAWGGRLTVAGELRFDRRGLARELWRVRAAGRLPGGLLASGEARLGSGRSAFGWLDPDVPGGAWVATGAASERVRLDVGRPGRVTPSLAWISTRSAAGTRSEARLGLEWSVGDPHRSPEESRP